MSVLHMNSALYGTQQYATDYYPDPDVPNP
jgi:hypothetical protein